MPLTRIDLVRGKTPAYRRGVGEVVYRSLVEVAGVPANDRFLVIAEHEPEDFVFDEGYLGIRRTPDCVMIQITFNAGRSVAVKQALYKAIADGLHEALGLRREDVFINLVETPKENWSFGNGVAQYV
jgi:4-oxalocrotonate tautomerase